MQRQTKCFYSCREYTTEKQLKEFSQALLSWKPKVKAYTESFADWDKAFSFIGELEDERKTVIVIDEFPYMCKNNPSIPSILQIIWDTVLKDKNIMLVICGSSMSFIEKELLSEKIRFMAEQQASMRCYRYRIMTR